MSRELVPPDPSCNKVCRYCNRPLMKIDRCGEVLIG